MHEHHYENESRDYYDHIATHFEKTFDGFLSSFFKRYIVRHLKLQPGERVLDVGCANGVLLELLQENTEIDAHGLDISSEMIRVAKARAPQMDFICGRAEDLPFTDKSMDVVICSASFHHFPHPDSFLEEAMRVLVPGGRLVVAEIHIPFVTRLYNWRLARFSHEGDVKVYRPKELQDLFLRAGFFVDKRKMHLQIQYWELKKALRK
ncbi:MAG: class I SAM-dependent methyltransferase [Streptococcaceae bacterium]|jgi:ubiquinone/menaquinone biosynthesis C-methylase UbiE|nr:class I SAM-dependent methyltransferase [Streptococcaceae bacterium]